jgi:AAA domain
MTPPAFTAEPLSQVRSGMVRWLWEPYLPLGKLVVLDGDPGVGKSLLTLELAARLSRGGPLPDGSAATRPHITLLLSGEDNAIDTVRPRAEAAGADLDRIVVVNPVEGTLMRFPADLGILEELVRSRHVDLVVIDPIMAFLPGVAANADQCVRGVLNMLAGLAERTDCTILLVRHLRKQSAAKSVHRGLGSVGIIGAVRAGLLVAVHPADPAQRVLAVTKTNLGRTPPTLGFQVRSADSLRATIEWTGTLELSADALGTPVPAALFPRDRAGDWLIRELAGGPRKASDLLAAAVVANIPEQTLRRAKDEVRVKSQLVYGDDDERIWYWYDPGALWPKNAPFRRPSATDLPPLDPLC